MTKLEKALMLFRKKRFDFVLFKFGELLGFKGITPHFPLFLMVEPTNVCNLRCPACPTGSGKLNRPKRMMRFEEYKRIIDQVKNKVIGIALWNYGEPFLNKNFCK